MPSTPESLRVFAESLLPSDRVALEVTGGCWEVARNLEPHVNRVVVVSPDDTGIVQARAKTDRLDAQTLARLLWAGELEAVWMPDERCPSQQALGWPEIREAPGDSFSLTLRPGQRELASLRTAFSLCINR